MHRLAAAYLALAFALPVSAYAQRAEVGGRTRPAATAQDRFPRAKISFVGAGQLRDLIAGRKAPSGAADHAETAVGAHALVEGLHLLVGKNADRILVSPRHVAIVRSDGTIDILRRADAEAQVRSGLPVPDAPLNVGRGVRGPLLAEQGPAGSVRLFRQLPERAGSDIASTDFYTSFALGREAALHPFGPAGKTVSVSIPRALFDRAVNGEIGGSGWLGGGMGIDEPTEVQIESRVLRDFLEK